MPDPLPEDWDGVSTLVGVIAAIVLMAFINAICAVMMS